MTADSQVAKETLRLSKLEGYGILDTPPEPVYDDITALAAHICSTPTALVSLVDGNRQWFKSKVGLDARETARKLAFCAHTIQQSDILVVEDARQDVRFQDNALVTGEPHIRFYAGAPLITPDGHALGSLCVIDYQPRQLNTEQLEGLQVLSRQVVAQMELSLQSDQLRLANTRLEQRVNERTARLTSALNRLLKAQNKLVKREAALRHSSLHDPLTGLPNRSYFSQRLDQAIQLTSRQPNHLYAVLFIDLNDFKPVNDTLGHEVGDLLLKQVSSRIKLLLRKSDLVARLGGDEFAVLLDDIPNEEHAIVVVQRLQAQLKRGFMLADKEILIGASVGITFSSQGYRQPEAAIRDADVAMYQAKKQAKKLAQNRLEAQLKRNRQLAKPSTDSTSTLHKSPIFIQDNQTSSNHHYVVFDADTQYGSAQKRTIEDDLHRALIRDEFHLYYQPIFNLVGPAVGKICALEMLLRWEHPSKGLLNAGDFLEIAEEIGVMRQLSRRTIQMACQQLRRWRAVPGYSELVGHFNLSLIQVMCPELLPNWEASLTDYSLTPSAIQLEIKEQVLLSSDPNIMSVLQRMKHMGLRLCIDDFGRGYSSLSRLHQLNVSTLKIDKAFVKELAYPDSKDLAKTILDMGASANMAVIAEGIENSTQLKTLLELGCQYGQGFWLSEPLAAIAVDNILLAS